MFIMFTIIEIMKVFFSSSILNTCSFTFSKYSALVWNSLRWIFKSRHCFSIVENILSFITQITCCCYYKDYTMAKWSGKFFLKKYSKAIFFSFCWFFVDWKPFILLPLSSVTTHLSSAFSSCNHSHQREQNSKKSKTQTKKKQNTTTETKKNRKILLVGIVWIIYLIWVTQLTY